MSTSSPLHFSDNNPNFEVFDVSEPQLNKKPYKKPEIIDIFPPLTPMTPPLYGSLTNTPIDALSALRKYFSDEYCDGSDDSDGDARSDSMLDDEDWVNKQHRARQASLAQTFADALTIPALHPVQQKVAYYIGEKEKWKPPKYDIMPDHSNILNEKLLYDKKHLDENINHGKTVPKKLGPTDIGRVHGYKLPKYELQKNEEFNGTFLDKDKGWYHKPSQVTSNKNKLMTPTVVRSNKKLVSK
eukprot:996146_1